MTYYITASGRKINISALSEKDIHLSDIAHHLARICRYGGALPLDKHYSVASHSLYLANYALDNGLPHLARTLLMHDASEAYLGDLVSGLKPLLLDYCKLEEHVQNLIYQKYNISTDNPCITKLAKQLDTCIVLDEAAVFMPQFYELYAKQIPYKRLGICIRANDNLFDVKDAFLRMCELLRVKDEL